MGVGDRDAWPPCRVHTEQPKPRMPYFTKPLHGFLLCSQGNEEEERRQLQLINHQETVITSRVFGIIIQGLLDRNKPENYNSSFL